MNRVIMLFIQMSIVLSSWGQKIQLDNDYFYLKDSISNDLSFGQTVIKIQNYCSNDVQRLSLVAGWMYNNIAFDLSKFNYGGDSKDYKTVFLEKKGTCGDYAILFSEFCNSLGIENEIVEGYVQEYNSDNKIYFETNHAWNVVKINYEWYHCDLLGFSGYLKKNRSGEFYFFKMVKPACFLTQELSFITKHIPADPIWQLTNYPIPLDTLLEYGATSKIDTSKFIFDYKKEISDYLNLPNQIKLLKQADRVYNFNKNNNDIVVINYYNASVDLVNNWKGDKQKLILAKNYLNKAKSHLIGDTHVVKSLEPEIDKSVRMIEQYLR